MTAAEAPGYDTSTHNKFYTLSASLRETYDDNVSTSPTKQASLNTSLSPSVLFQFPLSTTSISGRYTLGLTTYSNINADSNGDGNGDNRKLDISHEFNLQLSHTFSERLSLSASERYRYFFEPSLFESTGTPYRSGAYSSNAISLGLSLQMTPKWGSSTSYSNSIVEYDSSNVGSSQNNIENTISQNFSATILPTISGGFGGTVDETQYDSRGYVNYTAFLSGSWQPSESVSTSGRLGATYSMNEASQSPTGGSSSAQDSISPYGALSLSWKIGKKSSLSADYSHEITPTDQANANGQQSDRVSVAINYAITPALNASLRGIYTLATITAPLINGGINSYTEGDYALSAGLSYPLFNHFTIDGEASVSGVSSEIAGRDYAREQFSLGIRGTY